MMEIGSIIYNSIAVFFSISIVIYGWKVWSWVWLKPKKFEKQLREQGYRGNPYKFLYGDFKEISKLLNDAKFKQMSFSHNIMPRAIPHLLETVNKFGKLSYLWFGPTPFVMIMEPEILKEVYLKYTIYQKPNFNPLLKFFIQGLVSYEGDQWAKHRKILNPAFHQDKLKLMVPAFDTCINEMLRKWDEIVSPKGSCEVDVWPYFQTMTSDAISRTAFGSNYEEGRRIFELQSEQTKLVMEALRSLYIPGWRFMPTKRNRRMKVISKDVDDTIRTIVDSRIKAMKAGKASEDDLLGMLLESNAKEIDNHGKKELGLTNEEVIDECKLFYFAGQETTSVLLTWTMILLSHYQDWQTRAREEVLQHFGTNKLHMDELHHLKNITMILHEVLRLYPPFPILTRRTTEETKLGNLTVPEGIRLGIPIMLLHHDPELWGDDVEQFKPERFTEGVLHATKGQFSYFPFGWGPRICIGMNFAMLEAKMTLAMLLQKFSFELSPSYTHAPVPIASLQPQHGAHLIIHKL